MTLADVVQLLHVVTAFWFVSGLVGRTVVLARARRSDDIAKVRALVDIAGPFERLMVIPGSMAVIALGILTWWAQELPLWGEHARWVPVSLIVLVAIMPMIPLVFVPRGKVFEAALTDGVRAGRVTPELTAAFRDPVVAAARRLELLVVAFVIVLLVTKPF